MRIIAKVILCAALAVGALMWGLESMDAVMAYRPMLDQTPPQPGEALGGGTGGQVVLVLIDGLRLDTSLDESIMPTLGELRRAGASAVMTSRPPSYSTPGYGVLMSGAWPEMSGTPAFNLDALSDYWPISQDHLFAVAKRAGLQTAAAAYVYFQPLLEGYVDAEYFTVEEDDAADREVVRRALEWIESGQYGLILVHIDQVDHAGHHEGGGVSAGWDAAANRADGLLAQIVDTLDFSRDTLVVLSDHGHVDMGGHGGTEAVTMTEPFVLAGARVRPGEYAPIQMVDVAPTLAAILGGNIPASTQGMVQASMLELDAAELGRLNSLMRTQQRQFTTAYTAAIGYPADADKLEAAEQHAEFQGLIQAAQAARKNSEMAPRLLVALAVLGGLVWLVRPWRWVRQWVWLGALGVFGLFYLRIAADTGRTFSYSTLGGAEDLILLGASGAIPGMLAVGLAFFFGQNWRSWARSKAAEAALDLGLASGVLILAVMLLEFVVDGFLPAWTLPDFGLHFFFELSAIQMVMTLGFTPLLAGITALAAGKK